jgi:uncharacterized NAD(P)/FAD-binding protein YdhS
MRKIAIVGLGPRGLYALEKFLREYSEKGQAKDFFLLLFDCSKYQGAGEAWNLEQPVTNWMNITERALQDLQGRPEIRFSDVLLPSFPSYSEWVDTTSDSSLSKDEDTFPPRAKMGRYLNERFTSIITILISNKKVELFKKRILKIDYEQGNFTLLDNTQVTYSCNEVLLTIGHQPTQLSKQLKSWINHVKDKDEITLFENAYPTSKIIASKNIDDGSIVGLRGFGLAMIDVARALTICRGGSFETIDPFTKEVNFSTSPGVPKNIIPFSLDGLPLVPKPLNPELDKPFTPTSSEISTFGDKISEAAKGITEVSDISFLLDGIAEIAARVYFNILQTADTYNYKRKELSNCTINWLQDATHEHALIYSRTNEVTNAISDFIKMATGEVTPSLDYCVGQVWRHCQPTIYQELSHAKISNEIMAEIIELDEHMKRYSYGPPVASMQQVLALSEAGIMDLDYVSDPQINLSDNGWELASKEKSIVCNVMIDCVLNSPKLLKVNSSLVKSLLGNDIVKPIHSELGIHTHTNGLVDTEDDTQNIPIAVLGRLSKGSVIGVDAILECFGPRTKDWAKGVIARF